MLYGECWILTLFLMLFLLLLLLLLLGLERLGRSWCWVVDHMVLVYCYGHERMIAILSYLIAAAAAAAAAALIMVSLNVVVVLVMMMEGSTMTMSPPLPDR